MSGSHKPLEYADIDDDEAREALCAGSACADPGCAAIEMTDALPEPSWVLNCAQDTTVEQVRYERRYAARPPASRSTAFAQVARKLYGGGRREPRAQYAYRSAPTHKMAALVLVALFSATLFAVLVSPKHHHGGEAAPLNATRHP
jgi:hypothetical protein